MRHSVSCALVLLFLSSLVSATAALQSEPSSTGHKQSGASATNNAQRTGEDVFRANCGRCHLPPMSLSPRISGTVIMHMRTRARLSREDERLLLKYMSP